MCVWVCVSVLVCVPCVHAYIHIVWDRGILITPLVIIHYHRDCSLLLFCLYPRHSACFMGARSHSRGIQILDIIAIIRLAGNNIESGKTVRKT